MGLSLVFDARRSKKIDIKKVYVWSYEIFILQINGVEANLSRNQLKELRDKIDKALEED